MSSAIGCSLPVKLQTPTIRLAVSTSRSRSTVIVASLTSAPAGTRRRARRATSPTPAPPPCPSLEPRPSPSVAEVWQHLATEEPDLLVAVISPELEHHVRAARVAVLLDRGDAVRRRPGDRPALVEERVRDLRLRREPSALLHRLGHRADLVHLDARELEERVGGAGDVLHLVREVHPRDLARPVATRVAVRRVDRRDDGAA